MIPLKIMYLYGNIMIGVLNKVAQMLEDLGSSTSTGIHIDDISLPEPEGQIKHNVIMKIIEKRESSFHFVIVLYVFVIEYEE